MKPSADRPTVRAPTCNFGQIRSLEHKEHREKNVPISPTVSTRRIPQLPTNHRQRHNSGHTDRSRKRNDCSSGIGPLDKGMHRASHNRESSQHRTELTSDRWPSPCQAEPQRPVQQQTSALQEVTWCGTGSETPCCLDKQDLAITEFKDIGVQTTMGFKAPMGRMNPNEGSPERSP